MAEGCCFGDCVDQPIGAPLYRRDGAAAGIFGVPHGSYTSMSWHPNHRFSRTDEVGIQRVGDEPPHPRKVELRAMGNRGAREQSISDTFAVRGGCCNPRVHHDQLKEIP